MIFLTRTLNHAGEIQLHDMGWPAAALAVVILSGFISISAESTCDIYAEVGQNRNLPFEFKGLTNAHTLTWTHNTRTIYSSTRGKVTVGKKEDVTLMGSLLLNNLQVSAAGTYNATVVDLNRGNTTAWSAHLCVMDKVSKPHLKHVCDLRSGQVTLICEGTSPQGSVLSWTQDKKKLIGETRQTLTRSLAQLKGEENFMCSVSNKVSTENSNVVQPCCKCQSSSCFKSVPVLAVVAGEGALILALLIVIVLLCRRHKRSKTQKKPRNVVELRMPSVKQQDPAPVSPDYETMNATEDYPRLSPKPSPRGCYKNASQPEGQTGTRPAQLSPVEERRDPSPVPKPRKMSPLNANV